LYCISYVRNAVTFSQKERPQQENGTSAQLLSVFFHGAQLLYSDSHRPEDEAMARLTMEHTRARMHVCFSACALQRGGEKSESSRSRSASGPALNMPLDPTLTWSLQCGNTDMEED